VVTAFPDVPTAFVNLGEGGVRRFMLPGFRFLLAAITLSTSMLVFGLGAAALLRAAHEQFASNPSWHAAPEATFAQQQVEPVAPVLAMLHAEPAPVELKAPDLKTLDNVSALSVPAVAPPLGEAMNIATSAQSTPASPAAPEQGLVAPTASEPERVAALKPEQTSAPEPTPAKAVIAEDPPPGSPASGQNRAPASEGIAAATSSSPPDNTLAPTKQAALAPVMTQTNETVANETAAGETAPSEAASAESEAGAAAPEMDMISTKLAALDSRGRIVQPRPRPNAAIASAKKRLARQAALRRKLAAQARQAALLPPLFAPFPQQPNQPTGVMPKH
jgi:hypothetical protein